MCREMFLDQTDTDVTISEERTEQNHEKVILEWKITVLHSSRQIMEEVTFSMEAGRESGNRRTKQERKDNHFA